MADYDVQIKNVENGVSSNIYPLTKASNATVTPNNNVPTSATDAQAVFDNLGEMAFNDGSELVYISSTATATVSEDETEEYTGVLPDSEINDSTTSAASTWSSSKLKSIFELLGVTFDSEGNASV